MRNIPYPTVIFRFITFLQILPGFLFDNWNFLSLISAIKTYLHRFRVKKKSFPVATHGNNQFSPKPWRAFLCIGNQDCWGDVANSISLRNNHWCFASLFFKKEAYFELLNQLIIILFRLGDLILPNICSIKKITWGIQSFSSILIRVITYCIIYICFRNNIPSFY